MLVFLIKMIIFANIKLVVIMRRQVFFCIPAGGCVDNGAIDGRDDCVYPPVDGAGAIYRLLCGGGQRLLSRGGREGEDRTSLVHAACHEPVA